MKKIFYICLLCLYVLPLSAQNHAHQDTFIYKVAKEKPYLCDCEQNSPTLRQRCSQQKLLQYFYKNIPYPKTSPTGFLPSRFLIHFIVEKDGSISNIEVVKGWNTHFNQLLIKIIKEMPAWAPAKQNGIPIRFYYSIPFCIKWE